MGTGRDPYVGRGAGVSVSGRAFVTRCSIAAAATVLVLAAVAGCVQSPTEDAIGVPQSGAPSVSPYRPDAMPTDLPDAVVTTDGAVAPASSDDPPNLPVTAPATTAGAPTTRPAAPATAAAPGTVAARQTTNAQVVVPTDPATTAANPATTVATQGGTDPAVVGPGQVDITCSAAGTKRRAVLTWQNKGFAAQITINGQTFRQNSTSSTSFSATSAEGPSGHGFCTGSVGGKTATRTY